MLFRVKLVVEPGELCDMLLDNIRLLELKLVNPPALAEDAQSLMYDMVDILIVSKNNIPIPKLENLKLIMQMPEPPLVIVLTSVSLDEQTAMLTAGCHAVLSLNVSPQINSRAINTILKKFISEQNKKLNISQFGSEPRLSDFVSKSCSMQVFINTVKKVVNSDSSLLILGETGVGKERLARAIHSESKRNPFPFIAVNCAA